MINYQFFPRSKGVTKELESIIEGFVSVQKDIDSETHEMSSNEVLAIVRPYLERSGITIESGKGKADIIEVPVLFGRNNTIDKAFYADGLSADGRIVIEVEAGRALANNQFLKDLFEACMMCEVEYLVLAVRNVYRKSPDFEKIYGFFETLYISNRLQLPLKGILLIGY